MVQAIVFVVEDFQKNMYIYERIDSFQKKVFLKKKMKEIKKKKEIKNAFFSTIKIEKKNTHWVGEFFFFFEKKNQKSRPQHKRHTHLNEAKRDAIKRAYHFFE